MLKGVIFDMDGVVVDSHPVHIRAWKRLLDAAGVVATDHELDIVRDGKTKEEILRHFMGCISADEVRAYAEEKDRLYKEEAAQPKAIKGVKRLLDQLRHAGITTAIASSGSAWRVHHTLETLGLKHYFSVVTTGTEFAAGKSDSTIFSRTAQRMEIGCEEVLVFEDSVPGTRSATSLGMKCLGVGDPVRASSLIAAGAKRVLPNFLGTSLAELRRLFTDHRLMNAAVASTFFHQQPS